MGQAVMSEILDSPIVADGYVLIGSAVFARQAEGNGCLNFRPSGGVPRFVFLLLAERFRGGIGMPVPRDARRSVNFRPRECRGSDLAECGPAVLLARVVSRVALSGTGLMAALTAGALLVTACSGGQPRASAPASGNVRVDPGHSSTLHLAGGLEVRVPASSVTGTGRLSGTVTRAPTAAPSGMTLAGPVYSLRIAGTRLTGHVRLTVPVPMLTGSGSAAGPDAALLVFYNPATGRWQPVPAIYDPTAHTLTATTPHLSIWSVLRLDSGEVLSAATSLLKGFIGVADTTAQPACPGNTQLTADGVTVASDKGNLVKWCAGVSGTGSPLLQVADNRRYAVETDYPADWSARPVGPPDPVTEQIITEVTHLLSPAATGGASAIIPGGETLQFTVPAGSSGEAQTRPSPEGYLIDAFLYGADTLAMTFGDIPGAPKANPSKTARAITLAFAAKECLTQIDAIAHNDVSSPQAVGGLFRSDVQLAVGCLGDEWGTAYGLTGFIGSFVTSVVLWLADGIRLVLDGLHAAIDTGIYWRSYRIAVDQTAPAIGAFRGQWSVHDGSLCVGQGLDLPTSNSFPGCSGSSHSGWIRWYEGCGPDPPATVVVCNGWAEVTFTDGPDGGIIGTVNNVFYTTLNNATIPGFNPKDYLQAGDTFELQVMATGLLNTIYLHTHLSQLDLKDGNPYWCGPGISSANQVKCGA